MAERRMFHTSVVESDTFLELPMGAQALYFHLGMLADNDGFCNNAKQVLRKLRRPTKELQLLVQTGYLLVCENIYVITHWLRANTLKTDRLTPLNYPLIAQRIFITPTKEYTMNPQHKFVSLYDFRDQKMSPNRISKVREGNIREENIKENNINECSVDSDGTELYADTLAYMKYLQARREAESTKE